MIKGVKMDYSERFYFVIDGFIWRVGNAAKGIPPKICDVVRR